MQIRHCKTILPASNGIAKVTALAWSPNSRRLAVVTMSRRVYLFDENGELKDKFSTKPANSKVSKFYIVTSMVFSPDSTKLLVGQSDDIIFIYKLGADWADKKSICNKFQQPVPTIGMLWPRHHQNEIIFGLIDGKVKIGHLRTNRTTTIYVHGESNPIVSLACCQEGSSCLVGHLDGSIYRFMLESAVLPSAAEKILIHGCVPIALAWGRHIVAAGPDCKVVFYDTDGGIVRSFDYNAIKTGQDFTSACFSPSGEAVILGCFNGFHLFSLNNKRSWDDVGLIHVPNLYTVSATAWKPDGSQLVIGSLCGILDIYDVFLQRKMFKGIFEFAYISKFQVTVTKLSSNEKIILRSHFGWEINNIDAHNDQYIVARTRDSLLVGDIKSSKLSEVRVCMHACGMHEQFVVACEDMHAHARQLSQRRDRGHMHAVKVNR